MRKYLSVILITLLVFSMTACNNEAKNINSNESTSSIVTEKNESNNKNDNISLDSGISQSTNNSTNQLTQGGTAQENTVKKPIGTDKLHKYRNSNDMGSSRFLNGKVLVHCFFVDDNESEWKAEECDVFLEEQIKPALDFISNKAKLWNINLTFDVKTYCDERTKFSLKYNGTVNKDLMNGGSTKDIFNQIAVNMGYASDCDFTISDDASSTYNDSIYLTIINKKGRSYTRNLYVEGNAYYIDNDVSEHCVVFSKDIDSYYDFILPEERSATVAHEILHLFGAEDYYKSERIELAKQYYFYDIMTLSTRNISKLNIMEMTAFTLGWTNEPPDLCYNSKWAGGRYEIE